MRRSQCMFSRSVLPHHGDFGQWCNLLWTMTLVNMDNDVSYCRQWCKLPRRVGAEWAVPELLSSVFPQTLVSLQAMSSQTEESARTVKMFQLRSWPNNHKVPSSANALIDMLTKVEKWQLDDCNGRIPTCVISKWVKHTFKTGADPEFRKVCVCVWGGGGGEVLQYGRRGPYLFANAHFT